MKAILIWSILCAAIIGYGLFAQGKPLLIVGVLLLIHLGLVVKVVRGRH